jgi:hypothetical protein
MILLPSSHINTDEYESILIYNNYDGSFIELIHQIFRILEIGILRQFHYSVVLYPNILLTQK